MSFVVLGAVLGAVPIVSGGDAAVADGPGAGTAWVVSLGDSYISGEAGRWAGNSNSSPSLVDALGGAAYLDNANQTAETVSGCHRASSAPVHIGDGVPTLNLACSGAKTSSTASSGSTKPGLDFATVNGVKGQAQQLQNIIRLQAEGNFQLAEDDVIVQALLHLRLRPFFLAAPLDDQAVQKGRQLGVAALHVARLFLFFKPVGDHLPRYRMIGHGKDRDHFGIAVIEDIADAAQNVVVGHNSAPV